MTSNVDLCNMALAVLGEGVDLDLTIDPPNSANARLCALWLPKAREMVLQAQPWSFASRRATLVPVTLAVSNVNTTNNRITTTAAHGMEDDDVVQVAATTTLPAPLEAETDYYIVWVSSTVFSLATEAGGSAIDLTTAGSGTITVLKGTDRGDRWGYAYALPTDMLVPRKLVSAVGSTESLTRIPLNFEYPRHTYPVVAPIEFEVALNKAGEQVIYTNLEDADLLYTAYVTDPTQFPPEVSTSIMWQLAVFLSAAIKRDPKTSEWCEQKLRQSLSRAATSDSLSQQKRRDETHPYDR